MYARVVGVLVLLPALLAGCASFDVAGGVVAVAAFDTTMSSATADVTAPSLQGTMQTAVVSADGTAIAGWTSHVQHGEAVAIVGVDPIVTGPYRLDSGDKLRIFVYAQPSLSRIYTVDNEGFISVPLIGNITARGATTRGLEASIRYRLGAEFVREPNVTVDIQQHRPFFILGEVRSAGQYPYIAGLTVDAAVAVAGGYSERANERKVQITRRINNGIERLEVPGDAEVRPGDTVRIVERWF